MNKINILELEKKTKVRTRQMALIANTGSVNRKTGLF